MKKSLVLIIIVCVLLVGCGKGNSSENNKTTTSKTTTSSTTVSTTTTSSTTTSQTTTTKKKTTAKKTTTKKATNAPTNGTTTAKKLGKNEYISTIDNKVHKFSFIYSDKATCEDKARGDVAYDTVYPVKPYVVLGCEEAKDLSGKSYWGIIYYEHADDNSKFYY